MKLFNKTPIFKNKTTYDSKLYNKFISFHNSMFGNKYFYFTIIISIFFLYCIIANLISKNIWTSLIILLFFVLFIYFRIFYPMVNYKKTCKTFLKHKKNNFLFIFYDNYYIVKSSTTPIKDTSRIYYFKLHKIIEDSNYFYLYLSENYATIISKSGFTLGTENEFRDFIKRKCLFKFKKL